MLTLQTPYTHSELKSALAKEGEAIHKVFTAVDPTKFYDHPQEVWSPADNLVHLIISISPVIRALNIAKPLLRLRFGKAKHSSRDLPEVHRIYKAALSAGGAASGGFVPIVETKDAAERDQILTKWQSKSAKLAQSMDHWTEAQLDFYQLPHPLLGNMTVREILLFTLYHNMHHVNDVHDLFGEPHESWFDL